MGSDPATFVKSIITTIYRLPVLMGESGPAMSIPTIWPESPVNMNCGGAIDAEWGFLKPLQVRQKSSTPEVSISYHYCLPGASTNCSCNPRKTVCINEPGTTKRLGDAESS